MKTHHIEITTYTIDEHPNQESVLEWIRDNWHDLYGWHSENEESLKYFCNHFGLSDPEFEISLCGHAFAYATIDDIELSEMAGARLWKYLNNSGLLDNDLLSGNCPFTGYCFDENLLNPIRAFMAKPDLRMTFQELIDECLCSWVSAYISDWEWTYSNEALIEMCQSMEYEFTEDGTIY